jgi:predicted ABC-type ATPase
LTISDHAPRLFVLAGTNGAGKSSIGGATIRARGGHYFNPDEAAAAIRQARPHLSHTQANSAAWNEGKRLLQRAVAERLDYNFETTLGGKSLAHLLKQAAEQGFEVRIWYVGLSTPEHHLARVKARVARGGHDIPEADIRRRFDQSRLQLIELLPHLAELRLYDNSMDAAPHDGLAPRPRLLLHWQCQAGTSTGEVKVPARAQALAEMPEWAKPVVMAALKAAITTTVKADASAAQPGQSRPAT